jgi:hypothetical protein
MTKYFVIKRIHWCCRSSESKEFLKDWTRRSYGKTRNIHKILFSTSFEIFDNLGDGKRIWRVTFRSLLDKIFCKEGKLMELIQDFLGNSSVEI